MNIPDYMRATDPELTLLLELARNHKMTAADEFEQRVSWVYGQLGDKSPVTKDKIREHMVMMDYAQQEVNALKAELAALRADAERLDWLEQNVSAIRDIGWLGGDLRAAIDARKVMR